MRPDTDQGESITDARQSVGQEEHGPVFFPDEKREAAVTSNRYLQWFVVAEVGRRPAVCGDEVVQKTACCPSESALVLWTVAWSVCASAFMLLLLVVSDDLVAAVCFI